MGTSLLSLGIEWLGHEADLSPPLENCTFKKAQGAQQQGPQDIWDYKGGYKSVKNCIMGASCIVLHTKYS
jgi:hypothetical protein